MAQIDYLILINDLKHKVTSLRTDLYDFDNTIICIKIQTRLMKNFE